MRDTKWWQRMMEVESGKGVEEDSEKSEFVSKNASDETQIVEELVYPFQLTLIMMEQYEDSAFNRENLGDAYSEILIKILRSVKFWGFPVPPWLPNRLGKLGVL